MKNNIYIRQLYEEGLGILFYQKPKQFIENKIKTISLKKLLKIILEIVYPIIIIIFITIIFILTFPL